MFVKAILAVCIAGLAFPIYGLPLPWFKLTIFRQGYILLFPVCLYYGFKIKTKDSADVLLLFASFAFLRLASLVFVASEWKSGTQQLIWFCEGFCFLILMVSLSSRFKDTEKVYLRLLFVIGSISIAIMAVQFSLLLVGKLWILPLSTSDFGFEEAMRPWTYPFAGGQTIGAFYEPNMSGSMCAFFIAVFLPYFFQNTNPLNIKQYWIMVSLVVTSIALMVTGSRQGGLASILALIFILLKSRHKSRVLIFLVVGALLFYGSIYFLEMNAGSSENVPQTIFDRIKADRERGDLTSGRLYYINELLSGLKIETVILGKGEGMAIHAAHNAYLIVLDENGVLGFSLLLWLSLAFVYKTLKRVPSRNVGDNFSMGMTSLSVVLTWLVLIFLNWAQLNQNISFLYLAIPLMFLNKVRNLSENSL